MSYDDWKLDNPENGKPSRYRRARKTPHIRPEWIHVDDQRPGEKAIIFVQYEGATVKAEYRREKFWDYEDPDRMLDVELWKYKQ